MATLVVAAIYVMGGIAFVLSVVALLQPQGAGGPAATLMIGSGVMLGLAAIADTLGRINAKLK
jgi:hypothetical protein